MKSAPPPPTGDERKNRRLRRRAQMRRGVIGVSASIGLYCGLIVALAYYSLHPPRFAISGTPDKLGLRYEEVRFSSATDHLPYATLDSAVQQRFRGVLGACSEVIRLPVERVGERMMGVDALSVSPLAAMPKIAPRPILLIHGTDDQICNVNDSRELAKAAMPGTAQLWIVPGAGHIGSYWSSPPEYRRHILAFLNASFAVPPLRHQK